MTDEEIKEWADAYGCNRHESELLKRGAKYHREQSDAKLKELRDYYKELSKQVFYAFKEERDIPTRNILSVQRFIYNDVYQRLNAIIEP